VRCLAVVHQRDAGPGVFSDAIEAGGHELESWHPAEGEPAPDLGRYEAILSFGGAVHPVQDDAHPWLAQERALLAAGLERELPLLCVCLGSQLLAAAAGAEPRRAPEPEIGWLALELTEAGRADPLLAPLAPGFTAFQWHSYETPLPPGAVALAQSPVCLQGYRIGERAWGLQFHAEVAPADAERWIADWRSDSDAIAIGLDAEAMRQDTATAIEHWNELGRGICERFLALAA